MMKSILKMGKKLTAILLGTAILTMALVTAIPASAIADYQKSGDFYIPHAYTDIYTSMTGDTAPLVTERAAGGVHLQFRGGDVGNRVISRTKYNVDGFTFRFDNLQKAVGYESDALRFAMMFGDNVGELPKFRIMIDTATGELSYFNGTVGPVVIASNDFLKYDTLSSGEFTVGFASTSEGLVTCTVTMGAQSVTGTVDNTTIVNNHLPTQISNFFAIAPGKNINNDDYHFSIDVTGIDFDSYIHPTSGYMPDRNSNNNNGSGTLCSANNNGKFPMGRLMSWVAGKDIGARITSDGAGQNSTTYDIDGISFRFSKLTKTSEGTDPQFTVCFDDNPTDNVLPRIRCMIDTLDGTVGYWAGPVPYDKLTVVGQSDLLKYENLSKSSFSETFNFLPSGDLEVTVKVGDVTAVVAILPATYYNTYLQTRTGLYYGFGPGNQTNRAAFSIIYSGFSQTKRATFFDGDSSIRVNLAAGTNGVAGPAITPVENECLSYWLSADRTTKCSAGAGNDFFNVSNHIAFYAVHRVFGDVSDDGEVNADDLTAMRRKLLGVSEVKLAVAADMDGDGLITIIDLIRLKKVVL